MLKGEVSASNSVSNDPSGREQVCREDDQYAADCEFDEDEEKEVDECQTRGRALPWSAVTLHELDRNVACEDVDVDNPHKIGSVYLLPLHECAHDQDADSDENDGEDRNFHDNHICALRKYARPIRWRLSCHRRSSSPCTTRRLQAKLVSPTGDSVHEQK
jgi:hypothetical protein